MRLLLDTHLLLWAAFEPRKLSRKARALITSKENGLVFSSASIWEVTIKTALGRPDFQIDAGVLLQGLLAAGYAELPILARHAAQVAHLPGLHRDPFDRMLIAQARSEGFLLLTGDSAVAQYGASIRLV